MKRVNWTIELDEDTPEAAAVVALAIQRDPDSTASVFDVACEDGRTVRVDLRKDSGQEPCLRCDNCGRTFADERELESVFPDIPDLLQRIGPCGIVPSGECGVCGALVYPVPAPLRVAILLEGGLVKRVLADREGASAAVLDLDTEGADESEIITVDCEGETLAGVPVTKGVTADPAFVGALFTLTRQKESEP